ncbi:hypothetical protein EC968_010538, partial [Mortierella alpina]
EATDGMSPKPGKTSGGSVCQSFGPSSNIVGEQETAGEQAAAIGILVQELSQVINEDVEEQRRQERALEEASGQSYGLRLLAVDDNH